jgi:hypothetical protein
LSKTLKKSVEKLEGKKEENDLYLIENERFSLQIVEDVAGEIIARRVTNGYGKSGTKESLSKGAK